MMEMFKVDCPHCGIKNAAAVGHLVSRQLTNQSAYCFEWRHVLSTCGTWAHSLRDEGNDAAHDPLEEGEARTIAAELRDFARLFLVYVYELPGRVDERRRARGERKAKS